MCENTISHLPQVRPNTYSLAVSCNDRSLIEAILGSIIYCHGVHVESHGSGCPLTIVSRGLDGSKTIVNKG